MVKKTSLNKGLEALLGDVAESKNSRKSQKGSKKETKENSSDVLLNQIRANQYQPRTSFDQKKLEELHVVFGSTILDDDKIFMEYNVTEGSIVKFLFAPVMKGESNKK